MEEPQRDIETTVTLQKVAHSQALFYANRLGFKSRIQFVREDTR